MKLINSLLFNDRTPKVIKKALDFHAQRTALTASNIANSETPGYKSVDLDFEGVLQRATAGKQMAMTSTDPRHIRPKAPDIGSLKANVVVDESKGRIDGNNVNIDKEMTNLAESQMMYNATITAYTARGATIKSALTETR